MTVDDFRATLSATEPPNELSLALAGLWWNAKGDWTRAHESAQQDEGFDGSWVVRLPNAASSHKRPQVGSSVQWSGF